MKTFVTRSYALIAQSLITKRNKSKNRKEYEARCQEIADWCLDSGEASEVHHRLMAAAEAMKKMPGPARFRR